MLAVAGPPLVSVRITNRDKRGGSQRLHPAIIAPAFSPGWCYEPRQKGTRLVLRAETKGRGQYNARTSFFLLPPEPFTRATPEPFKLLPSMATQAYGGAAIFFFISL
jgi:hypothetical protein